MNAALRASLTATPRPGDADNTCVDRDAAGWRLCWWRQGLVAEPFGPAFPSAKEACAASRLVREAVFGGAS